MTGRLSEEAVVQALDTGWQSLVWKSPFLNNNKILAPQVDFKQILDAKDPETAAHAIPRREMYLALITQGVEDALDILPLLSAEQFITIMDHEAWTHGHLSVHKAIRWLDLYKNLGHEHLYKKFRELDEEYQVALLNPYIEMLDEDAYENVSHDEQDKFSPMPCNTLWWRVKNGDEKIQEFVSALIEASISEDAAYIYSLLGMSAMMPPNEQEALLKQFRDARLEEDGFVTREESLAMFASFDGEPLYSKWKQKNRAPVSDDLEHLNANLLFLDLVLEQAKLSGIADDVAVENVQKSFAYVANSVSAACGVEPEDIHGITKILEQAKHLMSFGLEVLSDQNVTLATEILFTEYPKVIFKFAISTIDAIRLEALSRLKQINPTCASKMEGFLKSGKFGSILWMIDRDLLEMIGFDAAETLKGLFNRFPLIKDDVIIENGASKIIFRPVAKFSDYSKLLNEMRTIFSTTQSSEVIQ